MPLTNWKTLKQPAKRMTLFQHAKYLLLYVYNFSVSSDRLKSPILLHCTSSFAKRCSLESNFEYYIFLFFFSAWNGFSQKSLMANAIEDVISGPYSASSLHTWAEYCQYNSSVMRQKGESQNGYLKKTKHAKFFQKQTFLTPLYTQRNDLYQVLLLVLLVKHFTWDHHFPDGE